MEVDMEEDGAGASKEGQGAASMVEEARSRSTAPEFDHIAIRALDDCNTAYAVAAGAPLGGVGTYNAGKGTPPAHPPRRRRCEQHGSRRFVGGTFANNTAVNGKGGAVFISLCPEDAISRPGEPIVGWTYHDNRTQFHNVTFAHNMAN